MNDALCVNVLDAAEQFLPDESGPVLGQVLALPDALEQLAAPQQLRHDVRVRLQWKMIRSLAVCDR